MRLKELSEKLGLSQTTVSRALNGYPEVSQGTRVRVQEAARAHGYRPSQTAQGLATGKANAIGHIVPLGEHQMINPHFSDFIAGAGQSYSQLGFDMVLSVADPKDEEETYRRLSQTGRVDGFIVQGPTVEDPRIELLQSLGMPFVVHGRTGLNTTEGNGASETFSWLDVDNQSGFRRATEFLIDLGHRKIALLNGLEFMNFAHLRRAGYEDGLAAHGIDLDSSIMYSRDMSEPYGYEATAELLSLGDARPTAILTSSKLIATGAARALAEAGLTLAKDISILTFDDHISFFGSRASVPNFTCLRSSIFEAGARVAEMIYEQISNPSQEPVCELWEADLIIGKSTGPARL